jgi:hypothetical protein
MPVKEAKEEERRKSRGIDRSGKGRGERRREREDGRGARWSNRKRIRVESSNSTKSEVR